MKNGQHIKLCKVDHISDDMYTLESTKVEMDGERRNGVPTDHVVEGYLQDDVTVGKTLTLLRTFRNGVQALGNFSTSEITEVTEDTIRTENSVYKYEIL